MRTRLRTAHHYLLQDQLTPRQAVQRLQRLINPRLGVESDRSVLHYRTPAHRTTHVAYRASQAIPSLPFALQGKSADFA
jgi:hypothetical protein